MAAEDDVPPGDLPPDEAATPAEGGATEAGGPGVPEDVTTSEPDDETPDDETPDETALAGGAEPDDEPDDEPDSELEPDDEPDSEPDAESEPEPEPVAEAESESGEAEAEVVDEAEDASSAPLDDDPAEPDEPVAAAAADEPAADEPAAGEPAADEPAAGAAGTTDEPADDEAAGDEDLSDAVVVSRDDAPPPVSLARPAVAADEAPAPDDDTRAWFSGPAPEPEATQPEPFVADLFVPTTPVVPGTGPDAGPPPLPEPAAPAQPLPPVPVAPAPADAPAAVPPAGTAPADLPYEPVGETGYDDVTPGPDADGGAPGDTGYGYGYPSDPETTAITLRPTADMIRAHRRRERRRTLTFLGIFLGVLAMGLASFTFFQGAWTWPFGTATAAAPVCPTPTQTAPPAKNVTVKVYNASSRNGLARTVAGTLKKRGFQIGEVGNDPQEAKVPGVAVIRHGPAGLEAAKTVAAYIDGKVTFVPDERVSESVDLVLGKKFTKVRSAAAAAKALTPTLASVPAGCAPTGGEQSSTPSGSTAPAGTTSPSKGPSKSASKTPSASAT